ncbi:MAG TPA: TrmH family RNA methyltransferase, partial [Pseudomonadales bacterium]|nr:TrmH family RNA methyltransferase [Pseudomonadales bacterium]
HEWAEVITHPSLAALLESQSFGRVFGITTKGTTRYTEVTYRSDDLLLLGPETRGLPDNVLSRLPASQRIRIPMQPGSRSLNLANATAVIVYEVWRQQGFAGAR